MLDMTQAGVVLLCLAGCYLTPAIVYYAGDTMPSWIGILLKVACMAGAVGLLFSKVLLALLSESAIGQRRDEAVAALSSLADKQNLPALFAIWNGSANDCSLEIIVGILSTLTEEDRDLVNDSDQAKLVKVLYTIYYSRQVRGFSYALSIIGYSRWSLMH